MKSMQNSVNIFLSESVIYLTSILKEEEIDSGIFFHLLSLFQCIYNEGRKFLGAIQFLRFVNFVYMSVSFT